MEGNTIAVQFVKATGEIVLLIEAERAGQHEYLDPGAFSGAIMTTPNRKIP